MCGCIDVAFDPSLHRTTTLHWDAGRLSLNPGELIRIDGEERTPDRVRTRRAAELHSDAFRSLFMSVCFGCVSADLSRRQMRDWLAQALDNHVGHPHGQARTDKHTYRHVWSSDTHTHAHTDVISLTCNSQQRLVWCVTISVGCEQGQTRRRL